MPLTDNNSYDYSSNENPKCPYCDHVADVGDNDWYELYEDDIHEVECPNCEKEYKVASFSRWTFSTDKQD